MFGSFRFRQSQIQLTADYADDTDLINKATRLWVAHASRVLVAASRRNELLFRSLIFGKFSIARTRSLRQLPDEMRTLRRLPAATHRGLATLRAGQVCFPAEAVGFPLWEQQPEVRPASQLTRRAL